VKNQRSVQGTETGVEGLKDFRLWICTCLFGLGVALSVESSITNAVVDYINVGNTLARRMTVTFLKILSSMWLWL
jgi:hypothetical protein